MHRKSNGRMVLALFVLAMALLLIPVSVISYSAMQAFRDEMFPEMGRKSAAVGRGLADQVGRAVSIGIPLERLDGIEEHFAPVLREAPEIAYVAISDPSGRLLHTAGRAARDRALREIVERPAEEGATAASGFVDTTTPITIGKQVVGWLHVGIDQAVVADRLREAMFDVATVVMVTALVIFEILLFLVAFNLSSPMDRIDQLLAMLRRGEFSHLLATTGHDELGRPMRVLNGLVSRIDEQYRRLTRYVEDVCKYHFDLRVREQAAQILQSVRETFVFAAAAPAKLMPRGLADVRTPLFLFQFSEEMSRSFMPLYIRELYASPIPGIPIDVVIGMPVTTFMMAVAFASPWAGRMADRLGAHRVFLTGLGLALVGYILSCLAFGLWDFVVWRVISAVGYAAVSMAAQAYITSVTTAENRARGMSTFVGAVYAAGICGAAIGGVLADRLGYRGTFLASVALVLASAFFVYSFLRDAENAAPPPARAKVGLRDLALAMRNRSFLALIFFAAIPNRIALSGCVHFLVPIALHEQGVSIAAIGRIIMAYNLGVVLLGPLTSRIADRYRCYRLLILVGGLLSGLGMVAAGVFSSQLGVLLGVTLVGISHALSVTPQVAIVPDICPDECRELGQTTMIAMTRLMERMGSAIGPLICGAFIPLAGSQGAILWMGVCLTAAAAGFGAAGMLRRRRVAAA